MMTETDIEVILIDEDEDYGPGRRRRCMRTAHQCRSIGNRYFFNNGEKDYALVYWYGQPIPYTEDGFLKKGRI